MEYKKKQESMPPTPIVATSMHIKDTNTSTYVTPQSLHSQHTFNNNCYNAEIVVKFSILYAILQYFLMLCKMMCFVRHPSKNSPSNPFCKL